MTITAKELVILKDVMGDAAKFSDEEVDLFSKQILESQDSGEVVTFTGHQIQLLRGALMCFMFRGDLMKMAERLDIHCPGCPGCATNDCPDALDVAAAERAELAVALSEAAGIIEEEWPTEHQSGQCAVSYRKLLEGQRP